MGFIDEREYVCPVCKSDYLTRWIEGLTEDAIEDAIKNATRNFKKNRRPYVDMAIRNAIGEMVAWREQYLPHSTLPDHNKGDEK